MLTKSGTVLLGLLGAVALTLAWAVSFPASRAAERPDSKEAVPEIRIWTETGPKVERPYDPVKAKRLEDFAYKVFDPPFAIRCGNFDTKQISARFGGLEKGVRLRRWHLGEDNNPLSELYLVGVWDYPGLSIEVWAEFLLEGVTTWLHSITISSPDYALQHNLRVGLPVSKFTEQIGEPPLYGQPTTKEGKRIRYCSGFMDVTLTADQQDRVTEIKLKCGELCTR